MQVSVESGEGLEKRLMVDLPAERVSQVVDRKLQDLAKHVRLDGFRPGKVPMRTIKQRFGEQVRQEAYGTLIQETLYQAANQEKLMPAGEPQVELREAAEDAGDLNELCWQKAVANVALDRALEECDAAIAKVSVIGVGMKNHSGVASLMFNAIARENINIIMISTSEIRISCIIEEKYTELAVRVLHTAFGLDRED